MEKSSRAKVKESGRDCCSRNSQNLDITDMDEVENRFFEERPLPLSILLSLYHRYRRYSPLLDPYSIEKEKQRMREIGRKRKIDR